MLDKHIRKERKRALEQHLQ